MHYYNNSDLISIQVCDDLEEAEILMNLLENEGIPAELQSDVSAGVLSYMNTFHSVEVFVSEEFEEDALTVIQNQLEF